MKKILLVLIFSCGLFFSGYAQSNTTTEDTKEQKHIMFAKALYIIDGVEVDSELLGSIDPESIESISVLKDKTATDTYGEKGKNGVVIITTSKAKK